MLARLASLVSAGKRRFQDLSEQEILALAISSEEEDGRTSCLCRQASRRIPATAAVFDGMAAEEDEHRRRLIKAYQYRFGDFVVPLRREHVADSSIRAGQSGWSRTLVLIASVRKRRTWSAKPEISTSRQPDARPTPKLVHSWAISPLLKPHIRLQQANSLKSSRCQGTPVGKLVVPPTAYPHLDLTRACWLDGRFSLRPLRRSSPPPSRHRIPGRRF